MIYLTSSTILILIKYPAPQEIRKFVLGTFLLNYKKYVFEFVILFYIYIFQS